MRHRRRTLRPFLVALATAPALLGANAPSPPPQRVLHVEVEPSGRIALEARGVELEEVLDAIAAKRGFTVVMERGDHGGEPPGDARAQLRARLRRDRRRAPAGDRVPATRAFPPGVARSRPHGRSSGVPSLSRALSRTREGSGAGVARWPPTSPTTPRSAVPRRTAAADAVKQCVRGRRRTRARAILALAGPRRAD
jgi:hypothetical protein